MRKVVRYKWKPFSEIFEIFVIKHSILAKDAGANYISVQTGRGFSAEIAEYQAILFRLGYFTDEKYVDGYWGTNTKNAVIEFQRKNGLNVDGDLGGPRSRTKMKLKEPIDSLVPK